MIHPGRILFAIAVIAFGVELFIFRNLSALVAIPPSISFAGYILGTVFIIGGIGFLTQKMMSQAGIVSAVSFYAVMALIHVPLLIDNYHDAGQWTVIAELMALGAGALIVSESGSLFRLGQSLFAASLIIFAVQHFMYADYIATLIPGWIPGPVFFAYLVGVAFVAAAISIRSNNFTRLATLLLGIMFLIWVLILHVPRVAANNHTETEWTSMFNALAMAGISFSLAAKKS